MSSTKRNYTNAAALLKVAKQLITDDYYISLIRPGSKINTFDTRTTDSMKEVEDWVERGGNLGFRPGGRMVVVDVDVDIGGRPTTSGERVRAALCGKTFTVKTPSGGWHMYCKKPPERRTTVKHPWYEDVDFLTNNCNVVLPGSYITPENVEKASGKSGIYTVLSDKPFLDLPSEILTSLNKHYRNEQRRTNEEDVDLDRLILAIQELHNEDQDRNYWLKIGMALHAVGEAEGRSDEALTAWVEWSKSRPDGPTVDRDRDMRNLDKAWHSFHRSGEGGHVSGASILWMVKEQKEAGQSFEDLSDEDRESVERGKGSGPTHESGVGGAAGAGDDRASGMPPADDNPSLFHVEQLPDGRVKDIARYILDSSVKPQPVMAITGALHAMAMLSQGRYSVTNLGTRLNFSSIVALPSGSGKESAKHAVRALMPDETLKGGMHGSFASGPGLHAALVQQPILLWTADEMAHYLQQAANGKDSIASGILEMTLRATTSAGGVLAGKVYANEKNNLKPLPNPFMSVWATCTPSGLQSAISAGNESLRSGGMVNRLVPFITDYMPDIDIDSEIAGMPPADLSQWVEEFVKHSPGTPEAPHKLDMGSGAKALHVGLNKRVNRMSERRREIWNRAFEHSLKIAGLLALGSTGQAVTVEMSQYAVALVAHCFEQFEEEMASLEGVDRLQESRMDVVDRTIQRLLEAAPPKKWSTDEDLLMRDRGAVRLSYLSDRLAMNSKEGNDLMKHMLSIQRLILIEGAKPKRGPAGKFVAIYG